MAFPVGLSITLLVIRQVAVSWAVLPANYQSLSATAKRDLQWAQIVASQYTTLPTTLPPPGTNGTQLSVPSFLQTTFLWQGDEMPAGRQRSYISPYGIVGKVILRITAPPNGSYNNPGLPYTGLFSSGGVGVVRIALDAAGLHDSVANFDLTLMTKIYIDGNYSHSLPQVHDLLGQAPNHNVFLLPMSNIINTSFTVGSMMGDAFAATIPLLPGGPLDRPLNDGNLGLYEQAQIHSDGSLVQGPVVAPYQGVWVPNPQLAIPADSSADFRVDVAATVKPGDVMYTLFAQRTPTATAMELVGELVCDSEFIASEYGDKTLFFRHPSMQWRP